MKLFKVLVLLDVISELFFDEVLIVVLDLEMYVYYWVSKWINLKISFGD